MKRFTSVLLALLALSGAPSVQKVSHAYDGIGGSRPRVFYTAEDVQEKATLAAPVVTSITYYEIVGIDIRRLPTWALTIIYRSSADPGRLLIDNHSGVFKAAVADNPATPLVDETDPGNPNGADVLVKALNKANLSTKSLECRAIEHLVSEGKLPAGTTCTGAPQ